MQKIRKVMACCSLWARTPHFEPSDLRNSNLTQMSQLIYVLILHIHRKLYAIILQDLILSWWLFPWQYGFFPGQIRYQTENAALPDWELLSALGEVSCSFDPLKPWCRMLLWSQAHNTEWPSFEECHGCQEQTIQVTEAPRGEDTKPEFILLTVSRVPDFLQH